MENPAARLLSIFEQGREIPKAISCSSAWANLLNVSNSYEVPSKLGKLLHQAELAADIILASHPDESDAVRYWRTKISDGLGEASLNGQWQSFYKHIDSHVLNYLRTHAKLINLDFPQQSVSEDVLSQIKELAQNAKTALLGSELEPLVKLQLSRKLSEIIDSIDDYIITGFSEVFDTSNSLAGYVVQLPAEQKSILATSDSGQRIWETFKKISEVAQATSKFVALGHAIKQLFIGN